MEQRLLQIHKGDDNNIVFNYPLQDGHVKYAIYDFAGHVHLTGMLHDAEPYRIGIGDLLPGKYTLRIIEGATCTEGKFEKR